MFSKLGSLLHFYLISIKSDFSRQVRNVQGGWTALFFHSLTAARGSIKQE